jgi:hypothetical protein
MSDFDSKKAKSTMGCVQMPIEEFLQCDAASSNSKRDAMLSCVHTNRLMCNSHVIIPKTLPPCCELKNKKQTPKFPPRCSYHIEYELSGWVWLWL